MSGNMMPKHKSGKHGSGSNHVTATNSPDGKGSTNKMPSSKSGAHGSGSNHHVAGNSKG